MEIKIVLADDHKILRDGLRNVIEKVANLKVIGEADNGREALKLCTKLKTQCCSNGHCHAWFKRH